MELKQLAIKIIQAVNHPGSEFYWPFVVSAVLIVLAVLRWQFFLPLKDSLKLLGARTVWTGRSARLDIILSMSYAFLLVTPVVAVQHWSSSMSYSFVRHTVASTLALSFTLPVALEAILVTLFTMLAYDFATYIAHVALHKVPFLWRIHLVHHSATQLNIFTTHRQHPLEPFFLNTVRGMFLGAALALFYTFFPRQTPVVTIMGMGAGFFLYMFTVNLHHLHIPLRYPKFVRLFLISPHIHHLHHSKSERHHDKNYGVVFSFWDRLCGTYIDEQPGLGDLEFGVVNDELDHRLTRAMLSPFIKPKPNKKAPARVPENTPAENVHQLVSAHENPQDIPEKQCQRRKQG